MMKEGRAARSTRDEIEAKRAEMLESYKRGHAAGALEAGKAARCQCETLHQRVARCGVPIVRWSHFRGGSYLARVVDSRTVGDCRIHRVNYAARPVSAVIAYRLGHSDAVRAANMLARRCRCPVSD